MICDMCGRKGAVIRKISETRGKGKDLLIIENVPMVHYPNCGEAYFTAEVLHEIERIKLHYKNIDVKKTIEVAEYV